MEYAQNVLLIFGLAHQEYDPDASDYIITALACALKNASQKIILKQGTMAYTIYSLGFIEEKYNCSYGLNNSYIDLFHKSGFSVSGTDQNGEVRIMELQQERFYIITLFQPQLTSTSANPHRLISAYLVAAQKYHFEKNL